MDNSVVQIRHQQGHTMNRYISLLLLLVLVFLPGASEAGEQTLYCLVDSQVTQNIACIHRTEAFRPPAITTKKEMSAQDLDRITAGGLEHFRMDVDGNGRVFGRIILWDEVPSRTTATDFVPQHLPAGYMMNRVQSVGTFNDNR